MRNTVLFPSRGDLYPSYRWDFPWRCRGLHMLGKKRLWIGNQHCPAGCHLRYVRRKIWWGSVVQHLVLFYKELPWAGGGDTQPLGMLAATPGVSNSQFFIWKQKGFVGGEGEVEIEKIIMILGLGNRGSSFLTSLCQPRIMITSKSHLQWTVLSLFSAMPTQKIWKYLYR